MSPSAFLFWLILKDWITNTWHVWLCLYIRMEYSDRWVQDSFVNKISCSKQEQCILNKNSLFGNEIVLEWCATLFCFTVPLPSSFCFFSRIPPSVNHSPWKMLGNLMAHFTVALTCLSLVTKRLCSDRVRILTSSTSPHNLPVGWTKRN
jgi:hypothetical protein